MNSNDEAALRVAERRQPAASSLDRPAGSDFAYGRPGRDQPGAEAPSRQPRPVDEARSPGPPAEAEEVPQTADASHDEPGKAIRRRRPRTVGIGLVLFALAAGSGFVYWGYGRHFEATDDAFIAARQIAIAPKVTGYVTQVPVTDNEHVAAGGVIARIDDRDYRIALAQASAQVLAAQATIQNIDAQIAVQQAQIKSSEA